MILQDGPDAEAVGCFVLTRGVNRAWGALNGHLNTNHGGLIWIYGNGGTGKTHFLNYVAALLKRTGAPSLEAGRHLVLGLTVSSAADAVDVDRLMVEAIGRELAGDNRMQPLWRRIQGTEALRIVVDQARRQGVRTISVLVDFGDINSEAGGARLTSAAELARSLKQIKLLLVVASRETPPDGVQAFAVAPEHDELFAVAAGRARQLDDGAGRVVDDAYRAVDTAGYESRAIYPLHPVSAEILEELTANPGTVATLARMVREVLAPWGAAGRAMRLIYPAELMVSEAVRSAVDAKLGEDGRAALAKAYDAADFESDRDAARQTVDGLMLDSVAGSRRSLSLDELHELVPAFAGAASFAESLAMLLGGLAERSNNVIEFDSRRQIARFNVQPPLTRDVAKFNLALPLIRRFDSRITAARESSELAAKLKSLGDAMGSALEGAHRNQDLLAGALQQTGGALAPEQERAFSDFITLAEAGPHALVEVGEDSHLRETTLAAIAEYEKLAVVATAVPRLRAMREYLEATGLRASLDGAPARDPLASLELQCEVLRAAANPAAVASMTHSLDALEARFQEFKWTYVRHYRNEHEAWRTEIERLSVIAGDVNLCLEALRRLNLISVLGSAEGSELYAEMTALTRRIVRCDLEGPLSPEITPRCPRCGFAIGTASPREQLNDLSLRVKHALNNKLAALSQSAITRLIEEHDHHHRLEGFLKIIQAAQTDALVRVLDDKLTRYLARLLDENLAPASGRNSTGRGVVQTLPSRFKRRGPARLERGIKSPPSSGR